MKSKPPKAKGAEIRTKRSAGSQQRVVSRKSLVHGIANCMGCDWECQDYLTVQQQARKHRNKTGHKVSMELGYHVELCS